MQIYKKEVLLMARLTIYKDNQENATVVSNLFIDEYMKDANDAQLKVYLYLLRMMNAKQATSVSDIADKFNHTEKDIIRALKYWEKQQLMELDFDQDKTLVGIHMHTPEEALSHSASPAGKFVPSSGEITLVPQVSTAAQAPLFMKPVYSAEQLLEFKNRENTAQLLFITETYIGKPLTPSEIKTILFFTDELRFSDDLIDYLLQYCVGKGKKDFKYIEKVAISWAEQGISTPEEAQKQGGQYSKDVYDIVKALGSSNMPTEAEIGFINRWTVDFCFSKDIILEACRRTVLAVNSNRFKYADALLKNWHEQNVKQTSDILKLDENYHQKKKTQSTASRTYTNRFNQFAQNTYDFDALEKELLSN